MVHFFQLGSELNQLLRKLDLFDDIHTDYSRIFILCILRNTVND